MQQFNNKIYQTHTIAFKAHNTFKNNYYQKFSSFSSQLIIYIVQLTKIILNTTTLPSWSLVKFIFIFFVKEFEFNVYYTQINDDTILKSLVSVCLVRFI